MTEFVKREHEELEKFRQRVSKYGLEVEHSLGGHFEESGTDVFILSMATKPHPVRGNKKLIEQLQQDGFYPQIYLRQDWKTGKKYMAFYVTGHARIKTT